MLLVNLRGYAVRTRADLDANGIIGLLGAPAASVTAERCFAAKHTEMEDGGEALCWLVSMKETSSYMVDEKRKQVREGKIGSEPETILVWRPRARVPASCTGYCPLARPQMQSQA